jgi:hypothetical protein
MWRKATVSGNGACVEVNIRPRRVLVRDTKDPDGAILKFTHPEWAAFLAGVRASEFDLPV